jgi:hypothetical protein
MDDRNACAAKITACPVMSVVAEAEAPASQQGEFSPIRCYAVCCLQGVKCSAAKHF